MEAKFSIKISYSAVTLFKDCPRAFKLRYIDKITSVKKGSALYFGSAVDEALNHSLMSKSKTDKSKKDPVKVYIANWTTQKDNLGNNVKLTNNVDVSFSKGDFDASLIDPKDSKKLKLPADLSETFSDLYQRKDQLSTEEAIILNNMFWASLKTKGVLMIEEYHKTMLPLIDETLEVQKFISLKNKEGDLFRGVVDGIVKIDGEIVCLDNKTSSVKYGEDSVKKSEQLALYQLILNNQGYGVSKCAYFVLHKRLLAKSRVKTEIVIDTIPATMLISVLNELSKVNHDIKLGDFRQNLNSCRKPWGMCEFYNLCHNGSMDGLLKLEDT